MDDKVRASGVLGCTRIATADSILLHKEGSYVGSQILAEIRTVGLV